MPFDQFATWQLAGDLLPNATKEQKLATAFLRVGKRTTENGAIDEEYRVEYAVDRANTIGTGFLGHDRRLRALPRPQVRPDSDQGLLLADRLLQQHRRARVLRARPHGRHAGPTLPWTDAATEKKIADAQAAIRRQESGLPAARARRRRATPAAKADALLARPRGRRARRSSARSTAASSAYYPFDETAPVPDDQLPTPLPQARLSPPPLAPRVARRSPCTSNNGPLVSDEECRQPLPRGGGRRRPPRAGAAARAARRPACATTSSISPSAGGGAPPAVLVQRRPAGRASRARRFYFADNKVGILGKDVGYYERTQPFSLDLWVKAGAGLRGLRRSCTTARPRTPATPATSSSSRRTTCASR